MKPILFSLGPLHLYSFGLLIAAGVFLSLFLMNRQSKKEGFPRPDRVFDLVFVTVFSGFFGARLFYALQEWRWYIGHPFGIFAVWEGGLIFYGGVAGSLAGLYFFTRAKKISYLASLDFLLPYVALTHAFGRLGCFMNGCCTGRPCDLPWAVRFPGHTDAVHPTQLYETVFNLGLFFFLKALYPKRHFEGQITFLYFMSYAVGRFVIEFWRADNPAAGPLTLNQWQSLLLFAVASALYVFAKNSKGLRRA